MPYRRLPTTDRARLKALKTLLENNDIYTVKNRFIDWKDLNEAQQLYPKLQTAYEQYNVCFNAQARSGRKMPQLQHNAEMYLSHFIQVLFFSMQRGEIKENCKLLYSLPEDSYSLPNLKRQECLLTCGLEIIAGEKARLKNGGRPIYNPTIGMVSTHYDIFREAYTKQKNLQDKTNKAAEVLKKLRPEVDRVLLGIWNQVEKHFEGEPVETRVNEGAKYGVVYYYRPYEKARKEFN